MNICSLIFVIYEVNFRCLDNNNKFKYFKSEFFLFNVYFILCKLLICLCFQTIHKYFWINDKLVLALAIKISYFGFAITRPGSISRPPSLVNCWALWLQWQCKDLLVDS